jgi:hypothetical protein
VSRFPLVDHCIPASSFDTLKGPVSLVLNTNSVMNEIDYYFKMNTSKAFPESAVQQGLYRILKYRLNKLAEVNDKKYNQIRNVNSTINNKIERFLAHEKELYPLDTYCQRRLLQYFSYC